MILDVSVNPDDLQIGDMFLCRNGNQARFVGYDQQANEILVLSTNFIILNRYKELDEIKRHYTIVKVIKNQNIKISEVIEHE